MTSPLPDPRSLGLDPPSDPEDDPFATLGDPTGDLEQDCADEAAALTAAFRSRTQQENDRFRRATDSEYWIAVCFTSRDDKEAFLTEFGLTDLGDKYLDGTKLAERLRD